MSSKAAAKPQPTIKKTGRDVDAFRAAHDRNFIIPRRIKDAIERLGADSWEYEQPFMKMAELSATDIGMFRAEFLDFIVEVGARNKKRVWCGSKALANKLRAMV